MSILQMALRITTSCLAFGICGAEVMTSGRSKNKTTITHPQPARWNLNAEYRTLFNELKRQIDHREKIAALADQVFDPQLLIHPTDRDPADVVLRRTRALLDDLKSNHRIDFSAATAQIRDIEGKCRQIEVADSEKRYALYMDLCAVRRTIMLSNPLIDFDTIVFAKHSPSLFRHMSDQYLGWWSRACGGIYVLENIKSATPTTRCLTESFDSGSFLRPEVSFDGKKILFAYAKHYPDVSKMRDKMTKEKVPEDAFYHLFEMNADGTGLRQLTRGKYDDFDGRYLPTGEIIFTSTRRSTFLQCNTATASITLTASLPDSYVRCGGGPERPVSVYTLHRIDRDGSDLRPLSSFESFEWTPSIAHDGRILFARWDYIDRDNMPYMKLWSTNPDGSNVQLVYGNYTSNPYSTFEPRTVGNSGKIVFTASGHHSTTGGSLVLLDPSIGTEGSQPLKRLTPEVCYPESEGWPATFYSSPYPLSHKHYLVSWSSQPLPRQGRASPDGQGLFLYDTFGNLEPLYRDPEISSGCPIPLAPRKKPTALAERTEWNGPQEGRFLLQNVYEGLPKEAKGSIKRLRIVAMPIKTHPTMNHPQMGITKDDPGKAILGTVPVEEDGSAYFRVPSGVSVFFQALDEKGLAVQTMRSLTYVPPGQTISCVGCHEQKARVPGNQAPQAARRDPSRIRPGPEGTWPLRFDVLVQPTLDRNCTSCHKPESENKQAGKIDLTAAKSYETLIGLGPKGATLRDQVKQGYARGYSVPGQGEAANSSLLKVLQNKDGHHGVKLQPKEVEALTTWMDMYAQKQGAFSPQQEQELLKLLERWQLVFEK